MEKFTEYTNKKSASLHTQRGQTDTSLVSERGKTDDSLADHRKQTESDTDDQIKAERQDADNARAQSRYETDVKVGANAELKEQRSRDDAAMVTERSFMDAALDHERGRNDVESNKFLARERKETDRNLLLERTHSDTETLDSTTRLSEEFTLHNATRAALTSRDEFLAIVSHDLRNPIGSILSYAELLLDEHPELHGQTQKWVEVIKRNAETSLRLISDILDMERFAEGKLRMKFVPSDLDELAKNTVESFLHMAGERKITLQAVGTVGHDLVNCDPDRIAQVMANLVSNALKFTPSGGVVTISTHQSKGEARMSVTDTGPGIPEDQKKRIFNRYTQITNQDRQGLGLGLYISTMLIEAHQGRLGVDSELGKGSTFCFTIPISRIAL